MSGNEPQIDFWNSPSGGKWVSLQGQLDGLINEITSLPLERVATRIRVVEARG